MIKSSKPEYIHKLTIGAMVKGLGNLAKIMDKAEGHATKNDVALENLLQARLFPDMFNLLQQLQYVCYLSADFARHFSESLAPRVGYDETTWAELRKSVGLAADYLRTIKPDRVNEKADALVPIFMDDTRGMSAVDYAASVIIPDFHFHLIVAYALLRHNGVALGKGDFLGELQTEAIGKA